MTSEPLAYIWLQPIPGGVQAWAASWEVPMTGVDLRIAVPRDSGITITGRSLTWSPFDDPLTSDVSLSWSSDLGGVGYAEPGVWLVATIEVSGAGTLSPYELPGAGWADANYQDHQFTGIGPAVAVDHVPGVGQMVPEPVGLALFTLAGLAARRRACSRR